MVGLSADGDAQALAAARQSRAVEVGRAFAEIIRDEPFVRELWVSLDTEEPGVHLWLITEPIDLKTMRPFYGLMDEVDGRFPEDHIELHILNPNQHREDVHRVLRTDAEQVMLCAG